MDTTHTADETARRIVDAWRELRRGASVGVLRDQLLGADGWRLEQAGLDALEILEVEPDGWRMSEFADALRVDPSTATRAVGRLEQLGLAERVPAAGDRRVVLARITERGRRTLHRVTELRSVGLERLLEPFTPDERAELADYLDRFVASIDRVVAELSETG